MLLSIITLDAAVVYAKLGGDGIVLADDMFPSQGGWLTYDAGGAFDAAALASAVSAKMRSASGR